MYRPQESSRSFRGSKTIFFPTTQDLPLDDYPDISESLQNLRFDTFREINRAKQSGLNRFLVKAFQPAGTLDTWLMPQFPGWDDSGNLQWAKYKGVAVPATYVQRNLLGNVLGAAGFRSNFAPEIPDEIPIEGTCFPTGLTAPWDSDCGIGGGRKVFDPSNIFDFHLPGGEPFPEILIPRPGFARWGVNSGYRDYRTGDPWGRARVNTFASTLNNEAPVYPDASGTIHGGVSVEVGAPDSGPEVPGDVSVGVGAPQSKPVVQGGVVVKEEGADPRPVIRGRVSRTGGSGVWGNIGNVLLDLGVGFAQGYLAAKLNQAGQEQGNLEQDLRAVQDRQREVMERRARYSQEPQGMNQTIVLRPPVRRIDDMTLPTSKTSLDAPQITPLAPPRPFSSAHPTPINFPNQGLRVFGMNAAMSRDVSGDAHGYSTEDLQNLLAYNQRGSLPPNSTPSEAAMPSLLYKVSSIPTASAPTSPWAISNELAQQRQNEALLHQLKALRNATSRGNSAAGGQRSDSTAQPRWKSDRDYIERGKMKAQEDDIKWMVRSQLLGSPYAHAVEKLLIDGTILKEHQLYNAIVNQYNLYSPSGSMIQENKLTWPQLADITEYVAHNTSSDEEFSTQMWLLFGTDMHQPLQPFVNPNNIGLPERYKNTPETGVEEQFHHYLGGVTGTATLPTHLGNFPKLNKKFEKWEADRSGRPFNQGDIRLFRATQKHRDDFIWFGRNSVAWNIRKMLLDQ